MRANKTGKQRTPVTEVMRVAIFSLAQREVGLTAVEIRRRLIDRVHGLTEQQQRRVGDVPGLRACQVIVQKARQSYPLDGAFSLGRVALASVPSEAVPFLLDIYRTCLVNRTPFTVREALWCVRLRALAPDNPLWVYEWAEDYATRERVAEAFGYPFDTRALDARLAFSRAFTEEAMPEARGAAETTAVNLGVIPMLDFSTGWAETTAANLGVIPMRELFLPGMSRGEEMEAIKLLGVRSRMEPFEYYSPGGYVLRKAIWSIPGRYASNERGDEDRAVNVGSMEPDANMVFALWLGRILDTEKWASLTVPERVAIAQRLGEEVVAHGKARDAARGEGWAARTNWENWQPEELLKKVGIDPNKEQRWLDWYNERRRELSGRIGRA